MRPIDAEKLEEILRSRCAQCSDDYGSIAGAVSGCLKLVQSQPTIVPPPNPPLTLEELREMDGEPVWVTSVNNGRGRSWTLVDTKYEICREVHGGLAVFENYGKTWLAYRRKPEEGTA